MALAGRRCRRACGYVPLCVWGGGGGCGTPACSIVVRRWRTWRGSVCLVLQTPAGRLKSLTLSSPGEMWAWARNLHVTRTSYPTAPRLPFGTGRRWYTARLGSNPHSLTAFGTGGAATWAGSGSPRPRVYPGQVEGPQGAESASLPRVPLVLAVHRLQRYSPRRRGGPEGTTPEWPLRGARGGDDVKFWINQHDPDPMPNSISATNSAARLPLPLWIAAHAALPVLHRMLT